MEATLPSKISGMSEFFSKLGGSFLKAMLYFGGVSELSIDFFKALLTSAFPFSETIKQFEEVGIKDLLEGETAYTLPWSIWVKPEIEQL